MTNLSELLPSGGGAKEFEAVASGTLPSGQTVILKSDGKVEAVGVASQSIGSTQNWSGTDQVNAFIASVYDDAQQRVIIAFTETSPSYYYGQLIAGEVDAANKSITFGTASIYNTTFGIGHTLGYDSTNNKAVVFFQDVDQSSAGKARVASISGSTITFPGSNATYNSGSTEDTRVAFSPTLGSFLVVFKDNANSAQPGGVVGTVSGNNISFGGETTLDNKNISYPAVVWDSTYSKYLFFYQNNTGTQFRYQYVTVSGTTVTAGSPYLITLNGSTTVQAFYNSAAYDSVNQKIYLATTNGQNSSYASALVATSNGTTLTFGTENFFAGSTTNYGLSLAWDSVAERVVISYLDSSQFGKVIAGSVSGTTLTFGSAESFRNDITSNINNVYDPDSQTVVTLYTNQVVGDYTGNSVVFQAEATNKANFIGTTSQAIANSATGKVNPQGGVATSTTLTSATTFGGAEVFANNGAADTIGSTYDSNSNRIVVAYTDNGNSGKGTASVGTVSGDTISWGPQALFLDAFAGHNSITFDSSNNKVVIAYVDAANQGYAVVGTVDPSNNTITFGSATQFESGNTQMTSTVFDSSNNKVVIAYQDDADNDKGKAVVGVVSGTAITFPGSIAEWSSSTSSLGATFDSTNNRVVIFFRNGSISNHGYAVVGAVSGNNITFGSETEFWGADCLVERQAPTFDSTNNNVVLGYRDLGGGSNYGYAVAGTVSGNTITFGTPQTFNTGSSIAVNSRFDPSANKIVFSYSNAFTTGEIDTASLSGTVFTFDTGAQFNTSGASYNPLAYDSTAQKVVVAYRDAGNSNHGTAKVINLLGATAPFVVGSTYYVQNDGTLTTTSSTVTAGKAISTTQLILNGAS